ncbi:hypothetical protein OHS70_17890 [Streptomyces sp. NBC_00390]|uniref:hypothetical protein n=1 Tax=Streptomyces sp. NBC_00390 TaxID=2975736 RepID=UPI002E221865
MTPKLRARCAITAVSLFLITAPVAHCDERAGPAPAAAPTAKPAPSTSLAGRQAAEGRQRPGREIPPTPSPPESLAPEDTRPEEDAGREREDPGEVAGTWVPAPTSTSPAAARHQAPQGTTAPVGQQISPLSLGAGMALMGLGIGFLGLRLRRR